MKILPFPRLVDLRGHGIMADWAAGAQWTVVMAALHRLREA
jgi:hypothetical protein